MGAFIVDERTQVRFPEQWRAGLQRLENVGPDIPCSALGSSAEEYAQTRLACGVDATWWRRPIPAAEGEAFLCDAHAQSFRLWWSQLQRRRRSDQDGGYLDVREACGRRCDCENNEGGQ